jgi:hypothetical protein
LELVQDRPEGKKVARTFRAGDIAMPNDMLQRNVVTVFQLPTELNEGGNLLRGWSGRSLFAGWVIFAAEIAHE